MTGYILTVNELLLRVVVLLLITACCFQVKPCFLTLITQNRSSFHKKKPLNSLELGIRHVLDLILFELKPTAKPVWTSPVADSLATFSQSNVQLKQEQNLNQVRSYIL